MKKARELQGNESVEAESDRYGLGPAEGDCGYRKSIPDREV